MVALDINRTSEALAVAGGYVILIGLFSFFIKEKLFLSDALLATLAGVIFGPLALGIFNPDSWSLEPEYLTFQITRIVIAIQVLFTGIALPKAYLWKEWKSLLVLLGPVMTTAWFICGLLIWALIPGLTFLESLVIGSCVTPTDPVLANSICKGRFAEKHVPIHVRNIILAEAGANDGLGFPFLYIGLYLILVKTPSHPYHSVGGAVLEWFYNIVLYQILLSCLIGAVIGYAARKVLRLAEKHDLIDHESFLAFGVALTFFTLGVVGILGSDDILCCFVVGNSFTWDDWFRVQSEDHSFQDVIDQLLNSAIFLYIGAILPWADFSDFYEITPWRLVILGLAVMLVRRLPWVLALSHFIPALTTWREAAFAGFFGPIGVGAVFYTQVALEVIPNDGSRDRLRAVITPVNYFLVLTSVVIHGTTIPIGKGFHTVRTRTLTVPQPRSNRFSSSETKRANIRAFLPFTHMVSARQSTVAFGSEQTGDPGEIPTADAVRADVRQDSSSVEGAHTPALGSEYPPRAHADQPETISGERTPVVKIWEEGDQLVVERDGTVVEVIRGG